jgi:hypothetical protein
MKNLHPRGQAVEVTRNNCWQGVSLKLQPVSPLWAYCLHAGWLAVVRKARANLP